MKYNLALLTNGKTGCINAIKAAFNRLLSHNPNGHVELSLFEQHKADAVTTLKDIAAEKNTRLIFNDETVSGIWGKPNGPGFTFKFTIEPEPLAVCQQANS